MPADDNLLRRSTEIIAAAQTASGAYPACEQFPAYAGYCWFRDGSFIADAMSRVGRTESASAFHDWCNSLLAARAPQVDALVAGARQGVTSPMTAMLPTRYRFDGSEGDDPWWDFQLDGYGTWAWAVSQHAARHALPLDRWGEGLTVVCDYLTQFWNLPCYDWWEEHCEQRHGSTLGAVYAGLAACASSPVLDDVRRRRAGSVANQVRHELLSNLTDGSLAKWMGSSEVDASLAACIEPFRVVEPGSDVAEATLARIEQDLCFGDGVHRFRADVFYGGGQWPLLTCFLGWNHLAAGRRDRALELYRWAAAQADADLRLPEQVPSHLLHPDRRPEWLDRWGPVAKPLLWSHAMLLTLAAELEKAPE